MTQSFITPQKLPSVVIFDWDGTLVESSKSIFYTMNAVFSAFGKPTFSHEEFFKSDHISNRSLFKSIFCPQKTLEAEALYDTLYTRHPTSVFPCSPPLLSWLHAQNIHMAVVSNKKGDVLRQDIQRLQWQKYFYTVVGSYDAPEDKPSPEPLWLALEHGGFSPGEHVWFVGDSSVDMHCAHHGRCTPVAVGHQAKMAPYPKINGENREKLLDLIQALHRKEYKEHHEK